MVCTRRGCAADADRLPGRSFGVMRFVIADLGLIAGLIWAVKAGEWTPGVVSVTDLGRATLG